MLVSPSWSYPPIDLQLKHNAIHVWRASLDCDINALQRLEASLTPDEKSRAARFKFDRDRVHFIAARGILRAILGAYMRRDAATIDFAYGPEGKPRLTPIGGKCPISFNLSHSHGLALYAFSSRREVGIDVEAIRPCADWEEIAGRFFSKRELMEIHAWPPELQNEVFFQCWTRKEAYIKARGSGMAIPLESFEVSLSPDQPEVLRSADSSRWSLRSLQPAPGYVGAVVGEGKGWELQLWNWMGWSPRADSACPPDL